LWTCVGQCPQFHALDACVRWDRTLGSEMGRCTDHVPLPTLSQEAVTQRVFFILPASPCALTLFVFVSPSSFPYSECPPRNATRCRPTPPAAVQHHPLPSNATRCRPTPPAAVQRHPLPSNATCHSNRHHVAHTSFAAAPSEHAATHAPNCHRLRHPFRLTPPHPCITFALPFCLHFTTSLPCRAVSATNTHLATLPRNAH
jgi:hypothetical protein